MRRPTGDDGQLSLLILGLVAILLLLVSLVTGASKIYLTQHALASAADAAALAGANSPDEERLYTGSGAALPLTDDSVSDGVRRYVTAAELADQFHGFALRRAEAVDGTTAAVTLRATVTIPFVDHFAPRLGSGYVVTVSAYARSPLTD